MKPVDLGKSQSPVDAASTKDSSSKTYYPSLYLSDVPELHDLPDGKFTFECVGKVISHTESDKNGKKNCSCEIEIYSLEPKKASKSVDMGDSLDKALSEKESAMEDAGEMDESDDN